MLAWLWEDCPDNFVEYILVMQKVLTESLARRLAVHGEELLAISMASESAAYRLSGLASPVPARSSAVP
jgi:hypothetical protein